MSDPASGDAPRPAAPPEGDPQSALLAVSDLDNEIGQLRHRRASLPERAQLGAAEGRLAELDRALVELQARAQEVGARVADLDAQVAALTSRRATIEERLYSARGGASRDLQAMDEEVAHLSQHRSELEDAELAVMEEQEALDADLARHHAERDALEESAGELRQALREAEGAVDAEIAAREALRATRAATLPADLAARYEALRIRLKGSGAARLVGTRCDGCHLELPSMEVERIRHLPPGEVATCEQCGRILVRVPG